MLSALDLLCFALLLFAFCFLRKMLSEPVHGISDGGVCATSKALDQPAHAPSLIGAFACRLSVM